MEPKVVAAAQFAKTGGLAVIGNMQDAAAMLNGPAGTRVIA
jgi:carbamate kinase